MKLHAMSPAPSPRRRHSRNRAVIARRSKCCSLTSSAFCVSADYVCGAPAAPNSSSRWQPSRRTCADLQSWLLDRRRLRQLRPLREPCVNGVKIAYTTSVPVRQSCRSSVGRPKRWPRLGLKKLSTRSTRPSCPTSATKSATSGQAEIRLRHSPAVRADRKVHSSFPPHCCGPSIRYSERDWKRNDRSNHGPTSERVRCCSPSARARKEEAHACFLESHSRDRDPRSRRVDRFGGGCPLGQHPAL